MGCPQVEVVRLAGGVGALGESIGSQEDELGAERFAKRRRQFKRANSLELAADGFALRCHSRAESSQFFVESVIHAAFLASVLRRSIQRSHHSGHVLRSGFARNHSPHARSYAASFPRGT
jgi:hypothetical protein